MEKRSEFPIVPMVHQVQAYFSGARSELVLTIAQPRQVIADESSCTMSEVSKTNRRDLPGSEVCSLYRVAVSITDSRQSAERMTE